MKRLLLVSLAVLAFTPSANGQVKDYGSRIGLRGVKKIFLDTDMYREDRKRILEVLEKNAKEMPGVEVVDSVADAEVILYFRSPEGGVSEPETMHSMEDNRTMSPLRRNDRRIHVAIGLVVAKELGTTRQLLRYDSSKGRLVEPPPVQFAKAFVKAWAKANNLPPALKRGS